MFVCSRARISALLRFGKCAVKAWQACWHNKFVKGTATSETDLQNSLSRIDQRSVLTELLCCRLHDQIRRRIITRIGSLGWSKTVCRMQSTRCTSKGWGFLANDKSRLLVQVLKQLTSPAPSSLPTSQNSGRISNALHFKAASISFVLDVHGFWPGFAFQGLISNSFHCSSQSKLALS